MKISKKTLLIMGGVFSVFSLGLMFVSAAERNLSKDLNNAVQHIENVAFVSTGTNDEAIMGSIRDELVGIETKHFIIGETNNLTGKYSSSILGGIRNEIYGSNDVILAGSGNKVKGTNNSILGGEGNSVVGQGNGSYNVIIGGKNNKLEGNNSVDYSVILGGISNVIGSGKSSVVMGTHSSVNGSHSVALGSGSKVEANNSFLWTDGSNSDTLNSDNVFAIIAQSGAVINTDKAHSFAKLTLGGPMIVFSGRTGENIACGAGEGGGILKVVQSDNNQMCMCSCDGTGWNSMFGKGRCRSVCDVSLEPKCGETVQAIPLGTFSDRYIVYSGTCERGVVVEGTGAYLVTKDNKVHWSCQTEDGLVVGCSGSATSPVVTECKNSPLRWQQYSPEELDNMIEKGSSTYLGSLLWHYQSTGDLHACAWRCKGGYEGDGNNKCKLKTQHGICENSSLPVNAQWVNSGFVMTYNSAINDFSPKTKSASPATYTGNSSVECSFICSPGYRWNGSSCVQNECQGTLPTGATVNNSSAKPNTIKEYFCNAQSTEACAYSCGDHAVCNSAGTGCRPLDNGECYEDEPYGCMNSSNTVSKVDTTGDNQWKWYCVGQDGTGSLCTKSCKQGELKWTSLHSGTCVGAAQPVDGVCGPGIEGANCVSGNISSWKGLSGYGFLNSNQGNGADLRFINYYVGEERDCVGSNGGKTVHCAACDKSYYLASGNVAYGINIPKNVCIYKSCTYECSNAYINNNGYVQENQCEVISQSGNVICTGGSLGKNCKWTSSSELFLDVGHQYTRMGCAAWNGKYNQFDMLLYYPTSNVVYPYHPNYNENDVRIPEPLGGGLLQKWMASYTTDGNNGVNLTGLFWKKL